MVPREGAPSTRAAPCSSAYCQGSGWPSCTDGHRGAIQLGTEVGQRGSLPLPLQQARASPWQCPDTFGVKAGPGRGKGKQTWWLRLALSQVCPVATGSGRARAQEEGVLQGDGPGAGAAQAMWLPLVFPAWPGPQLLIPVPIHPGPLCLPPGPAPQSCPSLSVPTPVLASSHPWGRLGLRLASGFFQLL